MLRSLLCVTFLLAVCVTAQQNELLPRINCTQPNEEWTACGPRCGESCIDQGRQAMCPKACSLFGGCSCKEGYARDSSHRCIPKSQCPRKADITCANVRCAGPCEDTPDGPRCHPQHTDDVCSGNPCGHPCQRCVPEPKQCFTSPCPQYRCEYIPVCLRPPIPSKKPGSCPEPGIGICVDLCETDAGCEGSKKCCSNGCGHVCMDPINLH